MAAVGDVAVALGHAGGWLIGPAGRTAQHQIIGDAIRSRRHNGTAPVRGPGSAWFWLTR